jgi:rubrerythrin
MWVYDATEQAYKHGYEAGKKAAVVHGKWIGEEHYFQNYYDYTDYTCSVCGLTREYLGGANYCPNCGAKMDLED